MMNNKLLSLAFINTSNVQIDLSTIEESNPGIGGTEYLFLNVPFCLHKYCGYKITIYCIAGNSLKNSGGIRVMNVENQNEAYEDAIKNDIDILFTREDCFIKNKNVKTKLVLWLHLQHVYKEVKEWAKNYDGIVCVSKHERNQYVFDREIRKKIHFAYNICPSFLCETNKNKTYNHKILCFIGSLTPGKGFLSLAKSWPKIVQKIPEAKLYVIGSGNLYDHNQKLGQYGLAECSYENEFMKPIIDNNLESSVRFYGRQTTPDINKILKNVDLGIVNLPGNLYETFCMTAFDFARNKIPVACRRIGGIKETVCSGYDICFNNEETMIKAIIRLLKSEKLLYKYGVKENKFVSKMFDKRKLISQWEIVINKIANNKSDLFYLSTALSFVFYTIHSFNRFLNCFIKK